MDEKYDTHHKPKIEYLPTYRLHPVDGTLFNATKVRESIQDVLDRKLAGVMYDASNSRGIICELANEILDRVKRLNFRRYKFVVFVQLGSKNGQHVHVASRCIWAEKTDNFASASFQNSHLFAIATAYGLYQE